MCSGQHPCENSRWRNGNGLSVRPLETPCCTILSNLIGGHSIVIGTRKEQRLSVSLSLFSYAFFISLFFFFSASFTVLTSFVFIAGRQVPFYKNLPQPPATIVLRGRSFNSAQTDEYCGSTSPPYMKLAVLRWRRALRMCPPNNCTTVHSGVSQPVAVEALHFPLAFCSLDGRCLYRNRAALNPSRVNFGQLNIGQLELFPGEEIDTPRASWLSQQPKVLQYLLTSSLKLLIEPSSLYARSFMG